MGVDDPGNGIDDGASIRIHYPVRASLLARAEGEQDGVRPPAQAYCKVNILFMFQARVTRHSPVTLSRPRSENWRKPMADLMMPNTGSGVCLRRA